MTRETDRSSSGKEASSLVTPSSVTSASAQRKPRLALFVATAGGLGYLPKAPGTWGSLLGVAFAAFNLWQSGWTLRLAPPPVGGSWNDPIQHANFFLWQLATAVLFSVLGVWAADKAAKYLGTKDPQSVVVDEVSGQSIAYLGLITAGPVLHYWKYLLLGFILFRAFDIWKPFPARQAESLPGGWGIMADDWFAGIYAGLGLWLARAVGL